MGDVAITPRRSTNGQADHTEVYLEEQVMVIFQRDVPVLVSHISTGELDAQGNPAEYCEEATYDTDEQGRELEEPVTKAVCALAKTPGGVFTYKRMVEGKRVSPLGGMWNPVYFNYGIAVHGAENVPLEPASHGCVRIPMHISEYFQDLLSIGDRILVWNGEQEPENVSERDSLPSFDYADPSATTTTTTTVPPATTTTVTPSTTAPVAPATSSTTTDNHWPRPDDDHDVEQHDDDHAGRAAGRQLTSRRVRAIGHRLEIDPTSRVAMREDHRMGEFNGQVIAVVGATGGLGRAITEVLRERSATVVTVNRSGGADVQVDLRDSSAGDTLVEYVTAAHHRLDGVIIAAGIVAFGDLVDTDDITLEELLLTNTMGPIWLAKRVAPAARRLPGLLREHLRRRRRDADAVDGRLLGLEGSCGGSDDRARQGVAAQEDPGHRRSTTAHRDGPRHPSAPGNGAQDARRPDPRSGRRADRRRRDQRRARAVRCRFRER